MGALKGHTRLLTRPWMLLVGAVVLIASHTLVLRYALQHKRLSSTAVAGVMILVVIKHLGLLSPLYARFRERSRH
jgi:membrane protein YdbS with pleckstrin-like domain